MFFGTWLLWTTHWPPSTPQMPAVVPTAPLASSATMPPAPTVGAAALSEQPPRPLVLMVADESGAPRRAAVSRKQAFRDVFEWVRSWLHSPCWRIPPQTSWRVPSKGSVRRSNQKGWPVPQKGNKSSEWADLWLWDDRSCSVSGFTSNLCNTHINK